MLSAGKGQSSESAGVETVPADLIGLARGDWALGEQYRITLTASSVGLHVHQDAQTRLGRRVVKDCAVDYDADAHILSFPGIGSIHPTVVLLRRAADGLEFSFRSETSPGTWIEGVWETARRK